MTTRLILRSATLLMLAACAGRTPAALERAPGAATPNALSELAGQPVLVLPTQSLVTADGPAWGDLPRAEVLRSLDRALADTLTGRRLTAAWMLPDEIVRRARRNATFAPDPYQLAAAPLRGLPWRRDPTLPQPLATEVRQLVALGDARYALLPVDLRLEGAGSTGRAVLRLALIDPRLAQALWIGEVPSDSATAYSPAIAATIASRVADLIAAP